MVLSRGGTEQARRALERQLDYQQEKSAKIAGHEPATVAAMMRASTEVRARLDAVRPLGDGLDVLEVGCGAHGLIFFFPGAGSAVGIDPLSDHYAALFPAWQDRALTAAAYGEALPFADASFDLVLCDNVVDHAESPPAIARELVRVLRPGGLLYFTVNVHHPVYHAAATAHAAWRRAGVPLEIGPFADHTVHLTPDAGRGLFDGLPIRRLDESVGIVEARAKARQRPPRHLGDRLTRLFYKNAVYALIAERLAV